MPKAPPRPTPATPATDNAASVFEDEAVRYIAEITNELATMARSHRRDLLAYLLEMAHLEARGGMKLASRARASRRPTPNGDISSGS